MASEYSQGKKHLTRARLACRRVNERLQDCWLIYKDDYPEFADRLKILGQAGDGLASAIDTTMADLAELK